MNTMRTAWTLAAAAALLGTATLQAGTIIWDGGPVGTGTGTSWNAGVNWSGDVKPGSSDTAEFYAQDPMPASGLAEGKVISLDAPQTIYQLLFPGWSQTLPNFTIGTAADVAAGNTLTLTLVTRQNNIGGTETIAANVVLAANSTWNLDSGYGGLGVTVNGVISGTGMSLSKLGIGLLTLNGTNTYSGGTTISAGTLQLGNGSTRNGSVAGDTVNNSALVVNNPLAQTSGNISGTGSFTKSGAGTVTLGGSTSATSAGSFTINAGSLDTTLTGLVLSNSSYAWNGDFTYVGTQDLDLGTGAVAMNNNRTVTVKAGTLAVGGVIGGSTRILTKNGVGTLLLRGTNTYNGGTTVNEGIIKLTDAGRIGAGGLTVNSIGALTLDNTASNADHIVDTAAITLRGQLNLIGNGSAASSETAGALTEGAGPVVMTLTPGSGQSALLIFASLGARNTGAVGLYRGTGLGSLLGADTANIMFTAAPAVTNFGALAATDGVGTLGMPNAAVLRGVLFDNSATGTGIGFATYDSANNGVRLLDAGTEQTTTYAAGDANILLDLAADTPITGAAANTLQLNNTNGSARVVTNTGTGLIPHNGLLFSGTSAITLTGGTLNANLDANNKEAIILSLNTSGVTIGTIITGTNVTIGGAGDIRLNVAVNAATYGSGYVRINNAGTTTLAAAETGALVINNGTLKMATGGALYSGTQNNGANGTVDLSINKPGVFDLNGISVTANGFQGSGIITNSAAGLATLTGDWEPSGGNYSTYSPVFSGDIAGNVKLVIGGGGYYIYNYIQTLSGNNSFTGGVTLNNASMTLGINSPTALGTGLLTIGGGKINSNGQVLTNNNAQAWNNSFTFTGSGNLDLGAGAVTLGAANPTVTVSANTLTVGGAIGEGAAGRGFTKAGAGTLVLNGTNTYTGATTFNVGTLTVGAAGRLIDMAAALAVNNPNTGAGTTVMLNLNSTHTVGPLSGTITTPSSNNVVRINLNDASANLTVNQTADATFAGSIIGAGGFGLGSGSTGKLTLSGTNTYTGATTIAAGNLQVNGALSTGSVTVATGATLGGAGIIGGATTVNGTIAPGFGNSTGTLTVLNNVTFGNNGRMLVTFDATGSHSQLTVNGALDLSSASDQLELSVPAGINRSGTYTLASATGGITGVFNTVVGLPSGGQIVYTATTVNLVFPSGTIIILR